MQDSIVEERRACSYRLDEDELGSQWMRDEASSHADDDNNSDEALAAAFDSETAARKLLARCSEVSAAAGISGSLA